MRVDNRCSAEELPSLRMLADAYPSDRKYTKTSPSGAVEVTATGDGKILAIRMHSRWCELSEEPGLLHEVRAARQSITQAAVEDLVGVLRGSERVPGPGNPAAETVRNDVPSEGFADRLSKLRSIKAEKEELRVFLERVAGAVSLASPRGWFSATVARGAVTKLDFDGQVLQHSSTAAVGDDLSMLFERAASVGELSRAEFEERFPATYSELSKRGVV